MNKLLQFLAKKGRDLFRTNEYFIENRHQGNARFGNIWEYQNDNKSNPLQLTH